LPPPTDLKPSLTLGAGVKLISWVTAGESSVGMSTISQVRPTKTELLRLKRDLRLANRVRDILSERLIVLANELMARVKEAKLARRKLYQSLREMFSKYLFLRAYYGSGFMSITSHEVISLKIDEYVENILGVKIPVQKVCLGDEVVLKRAGLEDFAKDLTRLLEDLSEVVKAENAIKLIVAEIRKTRRKVNALDYVVIPRLKSDIKRISMKFDEREREEKARLKQVKAILGEER